MGSRRCTVACLVVVSALASGEDLPSRAVVLAPALNMYRGPDGTTDVVSQARYGMTVKVVEESGDWLRIETPDEYRGWSPGTGVRRLKADEADYASTGKRVFVEALLAHIYTEPSFRKHAPLVSVPFETQLEVLGEREQPEAKWVSVRLPDDRQGWIHRGDVAADWPVKPVEELIELGKRFIGRPYTWGGTSSIGFDCSGFTQMLCRRGGAPIPRDAAQQANFDKLDSVERDALQPGDLLFFGHPIERASHVGMYMGNGEFIHATAWQHPMVQVSRLEDARWTRLYSGARRWKR